MYFLQQVWSDVELDPIDQSHCLKSSFSFGALKNKEYKSFVKQKKNQEKQEQVK